MNQIWQFLTLLAVHWIADFVLQTHWQASNKSKNNQALLYHVMVYMFVMSLGVDVIFVDAPWKQWALFLAVNFVLHFATDWCTSRVSSRLFMTQFDVLTICGPGATADPRLIAKDNFTLHNFFVVIGLDQLIHQVTLALTMWAFLT